MGNPFDQFDTHSGPVYGAPPKVELYAAEDQQLQRDSNARAAEAAHRAAEADARATEEFNYRKQRDAKADAEKKAQGVGNGEQGMAAGFYGRALFANKKFGAGVPPRDPITQGLANIAPRGIVNSLTGKERQQAETYARDFVAATLRKESGAAISPEEYENQALRYFPSPGDTEETIAAKAKLRESAIFSLRNTAGPAAAAADARVQEMLASESQPKPRKLSPEEKQEFFDILESKGPDEANTYLNGLGLALGDKKAAAKPHSRQIDYPQGMATQSHRPEPGLTDIVVHGATLGLSDEAAGVGNAAANVITAPFSGNFDPVGAYQQGTAVERQRLDQARQNVGSAAPFVEFGGSLASGNVSSALSVAPNLIGRIAQGAKAGAAAGGLAGFGYGEGTKNSLLSALGGSAGGAALGTTLPVAGQFMSGQAQALRRLTGRDPNLARNIVGEAIEADGLTPAQVGSRMDEAHSRSSPMMIADTGENSRQLLASVGRQPGPSRTIVKNAVIERQNAQAERIGEAVARDLGPTANIREMGDELITRARTASAPLYDKAYSAPGASAVKLDDLARRPSLQKAIAKGLQIAQEEGVDATSLGVQIDPATHEVITDRVPSWKALDYLKRGLDDVVEGYRDKVTGKLNLDNEGRAVNATLRTLIARMDKVNPDYAAARAAYAGPAKMRDALEKGAKALTKAPDDILATMKNMGEGEQDAYRLGVRKAVTDLVASRRDGGDKVSALLGTPKSRSVLTRIFGGKAEFERFISTLHDEEAMGHTYKAVAGNSMTSERGAQDAATNDSGLANAIVGAAATGNPTGIIASAVAKLQSVGKFGAGEAGKRTRESVAALLTETDPDLLRELIRAAQSAASKQRNALVKRGQDVVRTGRNAGNASGMGLGALQQPQDR